MAITSFCVAVPPPGRRENCRAIGSTLLRSRLDNSPFRYTSECCCDSFRPNRFANRPCQSTIRRAAARTSSLVIGVPS